MRLAGAMLGVFGSVDVAFEVVPLRGMDHTVAIAPMTTGRDRMRMVRWNQWMLSVNVV